MKTVLIVVFGLLALIAVGWIGAVNQWAMFSVFAPKMEQVRYNTFKQSQAYNDGMAQQLAKDQLEWIHSTPEQKAAMQDVILSQYGSYNEAQLPPGDYAFLQTVRNYSQGATP